MNYLITVLVFSSFILRALTEVHNIVLNDGNKMPIIGIGTCCGMSKSIVYNMVKDAIDVGYRHVDTAYIYNDEVDVGQAVNEQIESGKIKRGDIFITTKVWNTFHSRAKTIEAVKLSLKRLNLKYIDLMLIHWPMGYAEGGADNPRDASNAIIASNVDYIETWQALEQCVSDGLIKSIGISNFNHEQIDRLLMVAKIKPAVNQIESHPYLTQKPLIEYCTKHGIAVTAYSPLGNGRLIEDKTIASIGSKHNKTAAQVLIKFQVQRGVSVIPKSTQKHRIQENFDVFNFNLTSAEMSAIEALNVNLRYNNEDSAKNHKYWPFRVPFI